MKVRSVEQGPTKERPAPKTQDPEDPQEERENDRPKLTESNRRLFTE